MRRQESPKQSPVSRLRSASGFRGEGSSKTESRSASSLKKSTSSGAPRSTRDAVGEALALVVAGDGDPCCAQVRDIVAGAEAVLDLNNSFSSPPCATFGTETDLEPPNAFGSWPTGDREVTTPDPRDVPPWRAESGVTPGDSLQGESPGAILGPALMGSDFDIGWTPSFHMLQPMGTVFDSAAPARKATTPENEQKVSIQTPAIHEISEDEVVANAMVMEMEAAAAREVLESCTTEEGVFDDERAGAGISERISVDCSRWSESVDEDPDELECCYDDDERRRRQTRRGGRCGPAHGVKDTVPPPSRPGRKTGSEKRTGSTTPKEKDTSAQCTKDSRRGKPQLVQADVAAEIAELRASIQRESSERLRLETLQTTASDRLAACEARVVSLSSELEDAEEQRESLRRQLHERNEKYEGLVRRFKSQQESNKGLERDLLRATAMRQTLETQAKNEHKAKTTSETFATELQVKIQQLEQEMGVIAALRSKPAVEFPSNLEDRLHRLCSQLQETVRAVQTRRANARPPCASQEGGSGVAAILAASPQGGRGLSPDKLRLLQVVSKDLASVGTEAGSTEEELPTEDQLMSEWSSSSLQGADGTLSASPGPPDGDNWDVSIAMLGGARLHGACSVGSFAAASSGSNASPPGFCASESPDPSPVPPLPTDLSESKAESRRLQRTADRGFVGTCSESASDAPIEARSLGTLEPRVSSAGAAAARAVNLSMRDLSEIKALKKPPPPIRMLMEICCMLFAIQPVKQPDDRNPKKIHTDYWEPARRYLLSDPFFLSKLRLFEADSISQAQHAKICRYFEDPQFTADRVRNCSKAAHELYGWVSVLVQRDPLSRESHEPKSPALSAATPRARELPA